MSRKLREGVSTQINEGKIYKKAVLFPGEEFALIMEDEERQKLKTLLRFRLRSRFCNN